VKLRGIDVDDLPNAQRSDVALLLGLVNDPDSLVHDLTRKDRKILSRHVYFADPGDAIWNDFHAEDPESIALVYRRLLS
jgi:hypothetical protein